MQHFIPGLGTEADADAMLNRLQGLLNSGQIETAEADALAWAEQTDHADAWHVAAVAAYRRGDLALTEMRANRAAQIDPRNAQYRNTLGLVELALGDAQAAIESFSAALEMRPDFGEAHNNLANALYRLGRREEAVGHYRRALAANPMLAEAWLNLGLACVHLRQYEEAEYALSRAKAFRADPLEWRLARAELLRKQGRSADAVALLEEAMFMAPDNASVCYALGATRLEVLDYTGAVQLLQEGRSRWPEDLAIKFLLGRALRHSGRCQEAAACLAEVAQASPEDALAHNELAQALHGGGQLDDAIRHFEQALALNPNFSEAHVNFGLLLEECQRIDAAATHYERAIALNPGMAAAYGNLGNMARYRGDYAWAEAYYRQGLSVAPQDQSLRMALALLLLGQAKFGEGWRCYTSRPSALDRTDISIPSEPLPRDLQGMRILLLHDQGIGDEIFFLRFAPELKRRGAWLAYRPFKRTASLTTRLEFLDQVVGREEVPSDIQLTLSIGDLPLALGMDDGDTPPPSLRITPLPGAVAKVMERLAAIGPGPYLGVNWRAGTTKEEEQKKRDLGVMKRGRPLYKEAPLEAVATALRSWPGQVIALQRNPRNGEIEQFSRVLGRPVQDFSDLNNDLEQMLALVDTLEDYATVSNTNVHLRALVGKTCRILLPRPAEWRWLSEGERSPWFPGYVLYREELHYGWKPALDRLAWDLSPAERRGPPPIPERYSRAHPSPRQQELGRLYQEMHRDGDRHTGVEAAETFAGRNLVRHAAAIRRLLERTGGVRTLLDYGSGKGLQYLASPVLIPEDEGKQLSATSLKNYWGVSDIRCYDPGCAEFSTLPEQRYDAVICTDVLEHCADQDIPWILAEIFDHAERVVYASIACLPARKILPNGENAHCTLRSPEWWLERVHQAAAGRRGLRWECYFLTRDFQGQIRKLRYNNFDSDGDSA